MIVSLVAAVAGFGVLCALIYRLAIYALPILTAVAAGQVAFNLSVGTTGSFIVGILSGFAVLLLGPVLFSVSHSAAFRLVLATVYAIPSAFAGYLLGLQLLRFGSIDGVWLQAFAVAGALAAGVTATLRLFNPEFASSRNNLA